MTSRRGFLAALIGAATLDPERLLWIPGKKMISIPKPVAFTIDPSPFAVSRMIIYQLDVTGKLWIPIGEA